MDPVTMIVAALAAGASAALKDTAGEAIKDAYAGLKALIKRKLGDTPEADVVASTSMRKLPTYGRSHLKKSSRASGAADDDEILKKAQELLAVADPEGTQIGKYNIKVSGGQVGAIGDQAHVTMNAPTAEQ